MFESTININIIQVYAATTERPDQEAIKFFEQLREKLTVIKTIKSI